MLQDSHLLPRGIYKFLGEPDQKIKDPIVVSRRTAISTSKQMKDFLLCLTCERLFNRNGEDYVLRQIWNGKSFPLLDRLKVAAPVDFKVRGKAYSGPAIGVDTQRLAYFGLSILWRSGAHKWKTGDPVQPLYSTNIDPYLEPMRNYLLGVAAFPSELAVQVVACTDWISQRIAYNPAPSRGSECRAFGFLTCGVRFTIYMGSPLATKFRKVCCVQSSRKLLFEADRERQTLHAIASVNATARPVGILRDEEVARLKV
jgi:hypothetical protein